MKNIVLIILLFFVFQTSCDEYPDDKIWVSYYETQCSDPWRFGSLPDIESRVEDYLEQNNIQIFDIEINIYSYGPFCEACFCPTGRIIRVLIQESDTTSIKRLGFNK